MEIYGTNFKRYASMLNITKVKTTPLAPDALQQAYTALVNLFDK